MHIAAINIHCDSSNEYGFQDRSNDRTAGVYKSLVLNVDDAANLLNSALNLQSSRNQSELMKPGKNSSQIKIQSMISSMAQNQANKPSHQRTKTTSTSAAFQYLGATGPTSATNNNSILKTFDYRMIGGNLNGTLSPTQYLQNVKSIQSSNQSQLKEQGRKLQIQADLRSLIKSNQPFKVGPHAGMSTTPNKYAPQAMQQDNQGRVSNIYQNDKRLSGAYQTAQGRNSNQFGIGQLAQVGKQNNQPKSAKKKTINQPHQRMFSPPQDRMMLQSN